MILSKVGVVGGTLFDGLTLAGITLVGLCIDGSSGRELLDHIKLHQLVVLMFGQDGAWVLHFLRDGYFR